LFRGDSYPLTVGRKRAMCYLDMPAQAAVACLHWQIALAAIPQLADFRRLLAQKHHQ
jgi:hypothetical protein